MSVTGSVFRKTTAQVFVATARAASRALVVGMSVYNAAVIAVVLTGSFGSPGRPILWVVTLVHGAMAAWCVSLL
jgi:hypothetical protein